MLATQSVIFGLAGLDPRDSSRRPVTPELPAAGHVGALALGVPLLVLTPRLWRGTRTAVALTIGGLLGLAALNAVHGRGAEASVEAGVALMLGLGRRAFRLGCSNRPRPAIAGAAAIAWALACAAVLAATLDRGGAGHVLARVLSHPAIHVGGRVIRTAGGRHVPDGEWDRVVEVLIAAAVGISLLALRSLVSPAPAANRHSEPEYRAARAIVDATGPTRCRRSCCGPTRRSRSPPAACCPTA